MIPKTAYFFWANSRMSFLRYMTLYSFRKCNPDWDMVLLLMHDDKMVQDSGKKVWRENQDFTYYRGPCFLKNLSLIKGLQIKRLEDYGLEFLESYPVNIIADIFKWKTLSEMGGLVSDMDILYVKPLPSFEGVENGVFNYLKHSWPIGFLVSDGGKMFEEAYGLSLERLKNLTDYQSVGPLLFHDVMMSKEKNQKYKGQYTVLPNELVYPFINRRRLSDDWQEHLSIPFEKEPELPEECIGVHWYGGCDAAKKWMPRLVPEKINKYRGKLIPEILIGLLKDEFAYQ